MRCPDCGGKGGLRGYNRMTRSEQDAECGTCDGRGSIGRRWYWALGLERWDGGWQLGLGLATLHCMAYGHPRRFFWWWNLD